MKKHFLMLAIASCLFATHAGAMTGQEHKVAKKNIEAAYKVDRTQCNAMKGNAKDVCNKEAKAKEKVAKAELEQQYKPSEERARRVASEKVGTAYDIAKEKCDDQAGDAKKACVTQAQSERDKALSEVNVQFPVRAPAPGTPPTALPGVPRTPT